MAHSPEDNEVRSIPLSSSAAPPPMPPSAPPSLPPERPRFTPATVLRRPPKSHGCLYALIALGILLMLIVGLVLAAGHGLLGLTDTSPQGFPRIEASAAEVAALSKQISDFITAATAEKADQPLMLKERDINILIQNDQRWRPLKETVYVTIRGDEIGGQISMPLDSFHIPFMKGRYLNGSATFSVAVRNGLLFVDMRTLEVKGTRIHPEVLSNYRDAMRGAFVGMNGNPELKRALRHVESIEVKDDALIVTPKKAWPASPEPASPEPASPEPASPEPVSPEPADAPEDVHVT